MEEDCGIIAAIYLPLAPIVLALAQRRNGRAPALPIFSTDTTLPKRMLRRPHPGIVSARGDLDSPVSLDDYDQAPFAFNGTIGTTKIEYTKN